MLSRKFKVRNFRQWKAVLELLKSQERVTTVELKNVSVCLKCLDSDKKTTIKNIKILKRSRMAD